MSTGAAERSATTERRRRSRRPAVLGVVGLGVALAAGLLLFAVTLPGGDEVTTLRRSSPQVSGTAAPTSAAPGGGGGFAFQPLWPFASTGAAAGWQRAYRADARTAPWHLNPGVTALSFARGYLGYNDLNKVFTFTVSGTQAYVGVGYEGAAAPAGVVRLARMGTGVDAPWEVVGTRDGALTISTPGYGTRVASPLAVGGRIDGTNQSVRVLLRGPAGVQGQTGAVASSPSWSAQVAFSASAGTVLTLAVSAGGHVRQVERFAVTAVVARASNRPVTDVDGDGKADTVRLVQSGSIRVDYGSGRVDVVAFSAERALLLGTADADRDGVAEVFVRTGSSAAGTTVTAFRYVAGRLRLLTLAGQQLALTTTPAGGSQRATWACGAADGAILTWSGRAGAGGGYAGLIRYYSFVGSELVPASSTPYTAGSGHPAPAGCGGIRQG